MTVSAAPKAVPSLLISPPATTASPHEIELQPAHNPLRVNEATSPGDDGARNGDGNIAIQRTTSQGSSSSKATSLPGAPSLPTPTSDGPEPQKPALVTRWFDRGTVLPNLQNPRSYTQRQKIGIVVAVALCSFSAPFASNIMMPSFPFIGPSLRLTHTGVALTTSLFLLALALGPLYHASLSRKYGRRPVYLGGFLLYTIASVACAVAKDGRQLVVYRFFQAFGSSAAQSIGMGTIADIYIPAERGRATGFWFIGPILGPMISPLIGGAVYQWRGWRAILWTTAIFGVMLIIIIILFLPETSSSLKASQAAAFENPSLGHTPAPPPRRITPLTVTKTIYEYTIQPLWTINLLGSPPIGLPALYSSVCFGSLYAISVATPFAFSKPPYKMGSLDISFLYLPACFGYCLGSIVGGYLSDREVRIARAKFGDDYNSEVRLRSARWGIPLVPGGLLIFGWGLHRHTQFAVPILGGFVFGVGLMLTNGTIMAYFTDSIPGQTPSVVAAYNCLRNVFAGFIAAVTTLALKSGLKEGWYFTLLALVCLLTSLSLEVVQRIGPYWREKRKLRTEADQARGEGVPGAPRS